MPNVFQFKKGLQKPYRINPWTEVLRQDTCSDGSVIEDICICPDDSKCCIYNSCVGVCCHYKDQTCSANGLSCEEGKY